MPAESHSVSSLSPEKPLPKGYSLLEACKASCHDSAAAICHGLTKASAAQRAVAFQVSDDSGWNPLLCAARHGWADVVQQCLTAAPHSSPNTARLHSSGNTALHLAALHGHLGVVRLLLAALQQHHQHLQHVQGHSPQPHSSDHLHPALEHHHKGKITKHVQSNSSPQTGVELNSSLAQEDVAYAALPPAAAASSVCEQSMVTTSKSPSTADETHTLGSTAARPACGVNGSSRTKVNIPSAVHGVDVCNYNGDTPLMFATSTGHLGVTALLLHARAQVKASNTAGITPLLAAAGHGQVDVLKLLLHHEGPAAFSTLAAATDTHGRNALHFAAASGHSGVVELLLTRCPLVDLFATSGPGKTPLQEAQLSGHTECERLLQQHVKRAAAEAEAAAAALLEEEQAAAAADAAAGGGDITSRQRKVPSAQKGSNKLGNKNSVGCDQERKPSQQKQPAAVDAPSIQAAVSLAALELSSPQQQPQAELEQQQQHNSELEHQQQQQSQQQQPASRCLSSPGSQPPLVPSSSCQGPLPGTGPRGAQDHLDSSSSKTAAGRRMYAAAVQEGAASQQSAAATSTANACPCPAAAAPVAVARGADVDGCGEDDVDGWTPVVKKKSDSSKTTSSSSTRKQQHPKPSQTAAAAAAVMQCPDRHRQIVTPHLKAPTQAAATAHLKGPALSAATAHLKDPTLSAATAHSPSLLPGAPHQQQQQQSQSLLKAYEASVAAVAAAVPSAAALDIQPHHVCGVGVQTLSMSQLDVLETIHRLACQDIAERRIQLARQQQEEEEAEAAHLRAEIAAVMVERAQQQQQQQCSQSSG